MSAAKKNNSSWKKIRKFLVDIHLWLGLASGIILFLVCLSGTIFTFSSEIQEMVSPEIYKVEVPENASPLPAEEIIALVKKENSDATVSSIIIPQAENSAYKVVVKTPDGGRRGTTLYVDQFNGEIKGDGKGSTNAFFMTMFRMHRWLLLDVEIGRPIVGVATIIFILMLLSGMVIWIPAKIKTWKNGLKIKTKAKWKRLNYDLHNALGFYSFILLLIMALTGLTWSFDWYKDGLSTVLQTEVFSRSRDKITSTASVGKTLKITEFINIADEALPYPGDYRINLPADSAAVLSISKNKTGFFAPAASDNLVLDQYSGAVLKTDIFSEKPFNEKVAASIKPLHMGYIYGTFSKILYFIACLIATSLPVTGTLIWINKLKKKKPKKNSVEAKTLRRRSKKREDKNAIPELIE